MFHSGSGRPNPGNDAVFLSVVVPFFDEAEVLPEFASELRKELDTIGHPYEVLFIDDGSTDSGPGWIQNLAGSHWSNARLIRLSRNFGHMQALTAGLDASQGEWVATLDADLQHPPRLIGELLDLAEETTSPIAQAVRTNRRGDSAGKRITARAYYATARRFSGVKTPANVADFRVMHRSVLDNLAVMPERTRVYRLLLPWLGYQTAYLEYEAEPRAGGSSKYSFARMIRLGLLSVASFTTAPLRIATTLGAVVGLMGIIGAIFVIFNWVLGSPITGWPSLMVAVLVLGGIQLLTIGILGEYLAVVLEQVRGRPVYVVDDSDRIVRSPKTRRNLRVESEVDRRALLPPPRSPSPKLADVGPPD